MIRTCLFVALLGTSVACSGSRQSLAPVEPESVPADEAPETTQEPEEEEGATLDVLPRAVGELASYRFTGSALATPATLTETIIARERDRFVVEYVLETTASTETLRVDRGLSDFAVLRVVRVEPSGEQEVERSALDALLERTAFAADQNERVLDSHAETCVVGSEEHECEVTRYAVVVGGRPATMTIALSPDIPGREVTGVIRASDGSVLYRAELVEHARGELSGTAAR